MMAKKNNEIDIHKDSESQNENKPIPFMIRIGGAVVAGMAALATAANISDAYIAIRKEDLDGRLRRK